MKNIWIEKQFASLLYIMRYLAEKSKSKILHQLTSTDFTFEINVTESFVTVRVSVVRYAKNT